MNQPSQWRLFPDPHKGDYLTAPFGPGCYEVRLGKQYVLYGRGQNVAARMSSLLPAGMGCGVRKHSAKREFIKQHLGQIEYRTWACASAAEAEVLEADLQAEKKKYLFQT